MVEADGASGASQGSGSLRPTFIKNGPGGWLETHFKGAFSPPEFELSGKIETLADRSDSLGPKPLWAGYENLQDYPTATKNAQRRANAVRTKQTLGRTFTWLAKERMPNGIVEFGTAFGVSGMFWLAGLEMAQTGKFYTFEPNEIWAEIAKSNLEQISDRFLLTLGTFEENAAKVLSPATIDIAFVDAIHTGEFVYAQYEILKTSLQPHALVVFDDISFSKDMHDCWLDIAGRQEVLASLALNTRVGIIELK